MVAVVVVAGLVIVGLAAWLASGLLPGFRETPPPSATPIGVQSDGPRPRPSPSPTPSPSPSPTPSAGGTWDSCPVLVNAGAAPHAGRDPERIASAELSFPVPDGWAARRDTVSRLLVEQDTAYRAAPSGGWYSFLITGQAPRELGFNTPAEAAAQANGVWPGIGIVAGQDASNTGNAGTSDVSVTDPTLNQEGGYYSWD